MTAPAQRPPGPGREIRRARQAAPPGYHQPVFILATARSYSTVTVAMLAQHPALFGFPELILFRAPTVGALLTRPPRITNPTVPDFSRFHDYEMSGLKRALAELHEHRQDPAAVARAGRWLRQRAEWPTGRVMEHLLRLAYPRTGVEKSPATAHSDESLGRCITQFPGARFIHLVRHPVTAQASMFRHWRHLMTSGDTHLRRYCARTWYNDNLRVARRLARMDRGRWMRLRAEDLLTDPASALPRVLAWLGLAHGPGVIASMQHPEGWEFVSRGERGTLGGGDPRFLDRPALRPVPAPGPALVDPGSGVSARQCRSIATLAAYLGY